MKKYNINGSNKRLKSALLTILVPLTLNACQITPTATGNSGSAINSASNNLTNLAAAQQTEIAKNTLNTALQKQRLSSYGYHVNVIGSNKQRREKLANATPQQLAMSNTAEDHCEHVHNENYVDLLKRAEFDGLPITNAKYATERQSIKQTYLNCSEAFKNWYEDDYAEYSEASQSLPGYDSSHTKQDFRYAKLLNAYLLEPTNITSYGVYRPLAGKVSMVPTLAYESRNLTMANSHFIYLDIKQGAVYLWADNFAFLLSAYFDNELGLKMQNKWIKIDINDGSLPKGFITDLIKTHIKAKDLMQTNAEANQYRFLTLEQLQTGSLKPDSRHQPYLKDAAKLVEQNVTEAQFNEDMELYFTTLYDEMTEKYPQLLKANEDRVINDETVDSSSSNFNSQKIFGEIFQGIQKAIENNRSKNSESNNNGLENVEVSNQNKTELNTNRIEVNSAIDYAVRDQGDLNNPWLWRNVYGLDDHNKVIWHLAQRQLSSIEDMSNDPDDLLRHIRLEILTRYSEVTATTPMFEVLPEGAAMPNPNSNLQPDQSNVIDLKSYLESLKVKYQKGEGTEFAKLIFGMTQ